ncbi:Putative MYB DNA-binding domain protein [Penicillium brasilianum]|uniref:Putative MYB DNA-binding domain protein n=1 Tax=Penicillium brasilianum TaxID=104259 RepID=A0A0F7TZQ3_PENBI|nr:Putative MYB DNA-binding domain protein [Penicillium brasilianum]
MAESQSPSSFEQLKAYSFTSDPEFANGLAIILGHAGTPASEAEMSRDDDLVLQAKCFFFSRKEKITPPLNFTAYKAWLAGKSSESNPATAIPEQSNESSTESAAVATTESSALPEPAYPTSFAHIVELITTGKPVPGIQQIPDTVLEGHDIASERPRRRKPWEKDVEEPASLQGEMASNAA